MLNSILGVSLCHLPLEPGLRSGTFRSVLNDTCGTIVFGRSSRARTLTFRILNRRPIVVFQTYSTAIGTS